MTEAKTVRTERHGDIALIVIDHPPVNAMSHHVRRDLAAAVEWVSHEPGIRAAVLACDGRTFVAGADIREFDAPPQHPLLGEVCALLDACPRPVVAAVHGTALGGGFELALACHGRVLSPDARVGLPETKLGLIPGAGGTQRLPRLVGALAARCSLKPAEVERIRALAGAWACRSGGGRAGRGDSGRGAPRTHTPRATPSRSRLPALPTYPSTHLSPYAPPRRALHADGAQAGLALWRRRQ